MWGSTPVDNYCERLDAGLFAEPLNALTNLGFLLSAWLVWRLAAGRVAPAGRVRLLAVLIAIVGLGSGLFHTFANTLTLWLDIVPILLFQLVFLWLYFRDVAGMRRTFAAIVLAVFLAAGLGAELVPSVLHGSLVYAPAIVVLAVLGIYHYRRRLAEPALLLVAAGVFLLSLAFRTADAGLCAHVPIGTHFLWHLLNAVVLYLVSRAYATNAGVAGPPIAP